MIYRIERGRASCFNSFVVRHFENLGNKGETRLMGPFAVATLLTLIVLGSFWWIWRFEMKESAKEAGTMVDLQRIRLDLDLKAAVEVLQQMESLSGTSLSSDQFRGVIYSVVNENDSIRSMRVLDSASREILIAEDSEENSTAVRAGSGKPASLDGEFIEELRGLPIDEVLISKFSVLDKSGKKEPTILLGTGLFFPSGARAGFLVADLYADQLLTKMTKKILEGDQDFFIVSPDGRWIYDSRSSDPWSALLETETGSWIVDEYPEVWRAIISQQNGTFASDGLWVFRDHSPLGTTADANVSVLKPGGKTVRGINTRPFYVVNRIGSGTAWSEIWISLAPILILFLLTLALLIPALLRRKSALAQSELSARELREASLRTRMAMEAAGISEWRIDLDAGIVETDKRMLAMLLLERGQTIRTVEEWEARLHPHDRRKVLDHLEPLWGEGMGTFSLRHRMKRGDGTWGWYRFRGAVRKDEMEGGKFILGAYIDLTDGVLREAELHKLEMATRQTLSGIAILDKEGALEWANPAFRERPEREGREIVGSKVWDLVPFQSDTAESEKELVSSAILRGEEFSLTISIHAKGKESSWRRLTGNPVLDEGGIPTHYVTIESDISREKRAESDLRKSESLLKESQKLAGIGSWEYDREEDSLYWSHETYRILGVSSDVVPGLATMLSFFAEGDREQIQSSLSRAEETGAQFEGEHRIVVEDNKEKWVFFKGMALRDAGVTSKVFGVLEDISNRKDYEKVLIRAREEAEGLNDQLADALNKAHTSEKKAQEASAAKSSFLSMVSHEIRNPLNGVIGMTALLRDTKLDEFQEDYVETIHSSGSTLLLLLDDILDFSRLEHGKIEFEKKKFSIIKAVEDSVALFSTQMAQKGLDFACWIDPEVPQTVTGDSTRVKQILFNLLGNAVKFTGKGSITVEVELRERLPNDRCLLSFAVEDTGIGIPKERHDRIFESFSQVDPSITRKFGGSGLGLAISKELSQRMGGDIGFTSQHGDGAKFEVILPFPAHFEEVHRMQERLGENAICFFNLSTRQKHFQYCLEEARVRVENADSETAFCELVKKAGPTVWIIADADLLQSKVAAAALEARGDEAKPVVVVCRQGAKPTFPFPYFLQPRPVSRKRIMAVLDGDSEKRAKEVGKQAKVDSGKDQRKQMKILVAEDNSVNQKVIRLLLKRIGYDCTIVENGALAVERALEDEFDLILMDIQMPEMDGIEATGKIVEGLSGNRRPWIVALTAGATRDNRDEALESGMNGYLTKPVQPNDLEAEIEKAANFLRSRK